jgi:hypothetical protein
LGKSVYGENYTKYIHTLCENIAELFFNIKAGGTYSYRSALRVNPNKTGMMYIFGFRVYSNTMKMSVDYSTSVAPMIL